jgi:hypothetical protein
MGLGYCDDKAEGYVELQPNYEAVFIMPVPKLQLGSIQLP